MAITVATGRTQGRHIITVNIERGREYLAWVCAPAPSSVVRVGLARLTAPISPSSPFITSTMRSTFRTTWPSALYWSNACDGQSGTPMDG